MPCHSLSACPPFTALPGGVFPTCSQSSSSFFVFFSCASWALVSLATLSSNSSRRVREDRRRCCPTSSAMKRRVLGIKRMATDAGNSSDRRMNKTHILFKSDWCCRGESRQRDINPCEVNVWAKLDSCSVFRWDAGSWSPARRHRTLALAGASWPRESDVCEAATPKKRLASRISHHAMLSSRLIRRPACQLLSRGSLAPKAPICRSATRAFHASAPRQDPLVDAILYLPHEMISLIHTAVPWYAALPLSAFIARGLLVTTAGTYARALMARYIGLHPLRQALAFQKRDEIVQQGGFRTVKQALLAVRKEVKEVTSALDERWNVTLRGQISWTVAQIPIFFAMAETIRQKCGARDGLIGMGMSVFNGEATTTTTETGELVARVTPTEWFEPSLAAEGMLWFPDLLLPDPTGVLPFIASGLMFANIYTSKNTVESSAKWPNVIRRVLLFVSLLIGPVCQNLPAALMLYWSSSTASVMLWNAWLDKRYPAPRGYTACKRPLLLPPTPASKGRRV